MPTQFVGRSRALSRAGLASVARRLSVFQSENGLTPTGEIDDDLLERLTPA